MGIIKMLEVEAQYLYQNMTEVKEQELLTWVTTYAKECGWLLYHTYRSVRSPSGFPDLVLLRPPNALFVELKRLGRTAKVTESQQTWLDTLSQCGLEALVWTPREIPEILERLR